MRNSDGVVLEVAVIRDDASQEDMVYGTLWVNRGKWITLDALSTLTGIFKTGSISSRIRSLRADGVVILKRLNEKESKGRIRVWEYMIPVPL